MNLRLRIVFSLLSHLYEVPYLTSEATLQECTDLSASMSIREHMGASPVQRDQWRYDIVAYAFDQLNEQSVN